MPALDNSVKKALLRGFEPSAYVRVHGIALDIVPQEILQGINDFLKYRYETMVDTKQGVIYIGKKL